MTRFTRWLDMPPVWLVAMIGLAYALDRLLPGLGAGFVWTYWLGNLLIGFGLGLLGLAMSAFLRARTTIIPRADPTVLLNRGVYRWTRNPIYLGDAFILAGVVLRWDVLPALILLPVFMAIITKRFIQGEEARLLAQFGPAYTEWAERVRRWV